MGAIPMSSTESTLTERYQTTVPSEVRKALGLRKHDKIRYTIQSDESVVISRADQEDRDPVCENFLNFLEQDMKDNPQRLQTVDSGLVDRARSLVSDVEVNLDEPLSDEEE
jgi:antitoxin PrlF